MSATGARAGKLLELDLAECERLLEACPIGRVGFDFAGKPMVLPVAYRYVDGEVVFRTGTGLKLHSAAANHPVAFEIDHWEADARRGWSVLVTGRASEIVERDAHELVTALDLPRWIDDQDRDRWVRIVPERITGRRVG